MVVSPADAATRLRQLFVDDLDAAESPDEEIEALAAIVAIDTATAVQRIAAVLLRPQGIITMPDDSAA